MMPCGRALRVGQSQPGRQFGSEDPVFSRQMLILQEQFLVHRTSHIRQQTRPFTVPHRPSMLLGCRQFELFDRTSYALKLNVLRDSRPFGSCGGIASSGLDRTEVCCIRRRREGHYCCCEAGEDAARASYEAVMNSDFMLSEIRSIVEAQWRAIGESHR